jgi:hypothetical protein
MTATGEEGTMSMHVYLLRLDEVSWRVSGLRVGGVRMGVEFPPENA